MNTESFELFVQEGRRYKVGKANRKTQVKKCLGNKVADQEITLKKRVKATERKMWEAGMQTKWTLEIFRKYKMDIAKESIYDSSREARCCLRPVQVCCELGCAE